MYRDHIDGQMKQMVDNRGKISKVNQPKAKQSNKTVSVNIKNTQLWSGRQRGNDWNILYPSSFECFFHYFRIFKKIVKIYKQGDFFKIKVYNVSIWFRVKTGLLLPFYGFTVLRLMKDQVNSLNKRNPIEKKWVSEFGCYKLEKQKK